MTCIKPHCLYDLVIWGSTDPCTTQQPLQLLQNNAVLAITGISRFEHITPSFRQLDILKIHDLCKIEIALNMHKCLNFKLPATFQNYFTTPNNVHHNSTRNKLLLTFYIEHILCHQVRCRSVFYGSAGVKANFK